MAYHSTQHLSFHTVCAAGTLAEEHKTNVAQDDGLNGKQMLFKWM